MGWPLLGEIHTSSNENPPLGPNAFKLGGTHEYIDMIKTLAVLINRGE